MDGEMRLNDAREMVSKVWDGMPDRFPSIKMDEFVVMPNHVHGIIFIRQSSASRVPPVGASLVGARNSMTAITELVQDAGYHASSLGTTASMAPNPPWVRRLTGFSRKP